MDFTDVGMQLSHCIHMMIIFRWNSSSKQEWTWEPFLVFVMSEINLYCCAIRAFLPSAGSAAFITSIMILSARPMLHRTFPVQDLIENATTDFAYQNLDWLRYCYSADVFRIHPTNPDDVVCFTLRQQPWFQCRLWCNIFAFNYFYLHFHWNAPPPFILWGRKHSRTGFSLSTLLENFLQKTEIFTVYYGFNRIYNHPFMN